jgi:ribosomal 30S subunit maturation factor RimM
VNKIFYLKRSDLKKLSDCEYYINDLLGCDVVDCNGKSLGFIDKFYDNGAQMIACLSSGFEFPLVNELVEIINLNDSSCFLKIKIHDGK